MTMPDQPQFPDPPRGPDSGQPTDPPRPAIRIGDAERNAAVDALGEHLGSGRLNLDEYGERSTKVTNARTMADIDAVFGDLPEPRPVGAAVSVAPFGPLGAPSSSASMGSFAATAVPAVHTGPNKALIALVAAMPFIALGLFFATGLWYFFLLIPLVAAISGPFINRNND